MRVKSAKKNRLSVILPIIMILVCCLALPACGDSGGDSDAGGGSGDQKDKQGGYVIPACIGAGFALLIASTYKKKKN